MRLRRDSLLIKIRTTVATNLLGRMVMVNCPLAKKQRAKLIELLRTGKD